MENNITYENFFMNTQVIFKGCKTPKRKPDFESKKGSFDYTMFKTYEHISSQYWYGEDKKGLYVIRESNHWSFRRNFLKKKQVFECNVSSCQWHIKSKNALGEPFFCKDRIAGKAYLKNFKKI